jgi:hypothetical protein
MKFTLIQLESKSKNRPRGYYDEILALSVETETRGIYELSDENYIKLAEKYRLPSILQQVKNLSSSLVELTKDFDKRPQEEIEKNLTICASCPFLIEESLRCGVCGCFLKTKVIYKAWHCPKNKW